MIQDGIVAAAMESPATGAVDGAASGSVGVGAASPPAANKDDDEVSFEENEVASSDSSDAAGAKPEATTEENTASRTTVLRAGVGLEGAGASLAEAVRESSTPGSFFASFDGVQVSDTLTCLGLMALPMVGRYPYVDQWDVETKIVLRARAGSLPGVASRVPPGISEALSNVGVDSFDFFFVAQDLSRLVKNRLPCTLNVLYHAWAYSDVAPGEKRGYGDPWQLGVFTHGDSFVRPLGKVDMAFQTLSSTQLHIHPQRGGMCCSPNNGRVEIVASGDSTPVCWFWSAAVLGSGDGARACVALHWLFLEPAPPGLDDFLALPSLVELLPKLGKAMRWRPCVQALHWVLGYGPRPGASDLELASQPMPSARPPVEEGGRRGRGEGGRAKGGGDGGRAKGGGDGGKTKGGGDGGKAKGGAGRGRGRGGGEGGNAKGGYVQNRGTQGW